MQMPAVELHVHLEGTLEPELILALAERNRVVLPYADMDDLRSRYSFTGLQSFLDLYYANMAVLRTAEDFYDLTTAYLVRAREAGVRHAEVFLDIQAHTGRGIRAAEVLDGVKAALATSRDHGLTTGLIVTFLRHLPGAEALAALQELLALDAPLLGVGLCSTELTSHASEFAPAFDLARDHGLHTVAHAGEEGPAQNVWDVLDILHAERVDHGVRAMEDPVLVRRLAGERVPLTVCPLSNVRLRVVDTLADHPLRRMLEAGLVVTVNSDDPAYFGGYVDENLRQVAEVLSLGPDELLTLARNGVEAAFVDGARRAELDAEVTTWHQRLVAQG
ncbi:adenosine deaminase [Georgenia sp. SUBG003]|uniref:adenosine deaminase n=1 Tax=Georgenia sp. SUBG003 TaxID=1497974 RepID=UPI0004D5989B|nr:adenine deaminase [Georgenia sp. SUBG003]